MRISDLLFRTNVKIPERREDGTYELADYTLGFFGVGVAALIRKTYTACVGSATAWSTPVQTWTKA